MQQQHNDNYVVIVNKPKQLWYAVTFVINDTYTNSPAEQYKGKRVCVELPMSDHMTFFDFAHFFSDLMRSKSWNVREYTIEKLELIKIN